MSFSGILVRAVPSDVSDVAQRLHRLDGVRVHQTDSDSGRLVLTLEAVTPDQEIDGLRRIQRVPGVVSADLVYHRIAEDGLEASTDSAPGASTARNTHLGDTT